MLNKSNIKIEKRSSRPIYDQIATSVIELIRNGHLGPGVKLPGSRTLAAILGFNRMTVVAAYDELLYQGWVNSVPAKGMYVMRSSVLSQQQKSKATGTESCAFEFEKKNLNLDIDFSNNPSDLILGDGLPDNRLVPKAELLKNFAKMLKAPDANALFGYSSSYGETPLRAALKNYFHRSRGLNVSIDNIMTIRGSQMGLFIASRLLLSNGGIVITGEPGYYSAEKTFQDAGGIVKRVPVDADGILVSAIGEACTKSKIRAVYVTPHHHYPTTVTLSADRRLELLHLADIYGFAIIEDDYDYDFNYENNPVMPLASLERGHHVIYIGSFSKIISPALRIGFMVAPKDFIDHAAHLRKKVDRQGNSLMEGTLAMIIENGILERHNRKLLNIYRRRRDLMCSLMEKELSAYFEFSKPVGGMAIWANLKPTYSWSELTKAALPKGLVIENQDKYVTGSLRHNGFRMGFSRLDKSEIKKAVHVLRDVLVHL